MSDIVIFTDTSRPGIFLRGIGPYSLATTLRGKGYDVEIIDFISGINYNNFILLCKKYLSESTKVVGISTTWMSMPGKFTSDLKSSYDKKKQQQNAGFYDPEDHATYYDSFSWALTSQMHERFVEIIRNYAPNAKLILGGGRALDFDDNRSFDHIVLGYAETELLDLLEGKELPRLVNHDIKAENGCFDFSQSQTIYSPNDFLLDNETIPIEIGRGCVFKCKYCSFPLIGKKKLSYMKDPEILYQEFMRNKELYNIDRYIISDDTFNDSTEKLEILASVIERLPFQPHFWCFARVDIIAVRPEQALLLQKIGVREVQFGIESFNPLTARVVGKGMAPEKKKETLYRLKELWGDNIHIKCSFIIGLPYETTDTINEHFNWMNSDDCPIDMIGINPFFLSMPDDLQHLRWVSDLDKNFEKYGYHFRDARHMFDWKKEDDTDIKSFDQCLEIYKYWDEKLSWRQRGFTDAFYYANCKPLGMDFETLFQKKLLSSAISHRDWKKDYLNQVEEYVKKKLSN